MTVPIHYHCVPLATPTHDLAAELRRSLTASPKTLPCKWLYDETGSDLFEQICDLPEYYLTRAESSILHERADDIIKDCPLPLVLVELGSGSSRKTRHLIAALLQRQPRLTYYPIDISAAALEQAAVWILRDFANLTVVGLHGEFAAGLDYLAGHEQRPRLIAFLGSTIGNLDERELVEFFTLLRQRLRPQDRFLLGFDVRKDPAILVPAYDDAQGVTARFNLNMLARLNREYGANFDLSAFAHRALFHDERSRIEMHLVSLRPQTVAIPGLELTISLAEGETIHTENSYKHSEAALQALLQQQGFTVQLACTDADKLFCVYLLR